MKIAEGCAECMRLSDAYESATMAWFRVEGNLRIAEYGRDGESGDKLAKELSGISERRGLLRKDLRDHFETVHPRVSAASA